MSRRRPTRGATSVTQAALWSGDDAGDRAGPSCPVQPERDVRVKRAQRSQLTWGRVDLDAEVPAEPAVRAIARLVELHAAYRWLCGGVGVAASSGRLNDFRSDHGDVFTELVVHIPGRSWRG